MFVLCIALKSCAPAADTLMLAIELPPAFNGACKLGLASSASSVNAVLITSFPPTV